MYYFNLIVAIIFMSGAISSFRIYQNNQNRSFLLLAGGLLCLMGNYLLGFMYRWYALDFIYFQVQDWIVVLGGALIFFSISGLSGSSENKN